MFDLAAVTDIAETEKGNAYRRFGVLPGVDAYSTANFVTSANSLCLERGKTAIYAAVCKIEDEMRLLLITLYDNILLTKSMIDDFPLSAYLKRLVLLSIHQTLKKSSVHPS